MTDPPISARSARSVVSPFPIFATPHHDKSFSSSNGGTDNSFNLRRTTSDPVKYSTTFFDSKEDDPDIVFRVLRRVRSQATDLNGLGVGVLQTIMEGCETLSTLGSAYAHSLESTPQLTSPTHSLSSTPAFPPAHQPYLSPNEHWPQHAHRRSSSSKPNALVHSNSTDVPAIAIRYSAEVPRFSSISSQGSNLVNDVEPPKEPAWTAMYQPPIIETPKIKIPFFRRSKSVHHHHPVSPESIVTTTTATNMNPTTKERIVRTKTAGDIQSFAAAQFSHTPPNTNPCPPPADDDTEPLPPPDEEFYSTEPPPPIEGKLRKKQSIANLVKKGFAKLTRSKTSANLTPHQPPKSSPQTYLRHSQATSIHHPQSLTRADSTGSGSRRSQITTPQFPETQPLPLPPTRRCASGNITTDGTVVPEASSRQYRISSAPPTQDEIERILHLLHHSSQGDASTTPPQVKMPRTSTMPETVPYSHPLQPNDEPAPPPEPPVPHHHHHHHHNLHNNLHNQNQIHNQSNTNSMPVSRHTAPKKNLDRVSPPVPMLGEMNGPRFASKKRFSAPWRR